MKIETLRKLWQDKNPNGNIRYFNGNKIFDSGKNTGKFAVTYDQDGKVYTYSASSVYKLAERFNLIPDCNLDYWNEAKKAIETMLSGKNYSTLAGCGDTISFLYSRENDNAYMDISTEKNLDEYDRTVFTFTLNKIYKSFAEYQSTGKW